MFAKEIKEEKYNESGRNRDTISDMYRYWRAFKGHWLPATSIFIFTFLLSILYASVQKPLYRAQGQLLFRQEDKSIAGLQQQEEGNPQASSWLDADRILDTETRVLLSVPVLQKTISAIEEDSKSKGFTINLSDDLEEFRNSLSIRKSPNTNVLVIAYQSTNPQLAALVVNQLMKTYLDKNLLATRATASAARKFITAQLPKVTENAVSADLALRKYKERYNITDLDASKEALTRNKERVEADIDSVEAQLSDLGSRIQALQNQLGMTPQQAIALSSLRQSPLVQGVLEDYREVQRKLADARARFDERHPTIIELQAKQEQVQSLLQTQVKRVFQVKQLASNSKLQVGQIQDNLTDELIKSEVKRIGLVNQLSTLNAQKSLYQKQAANFPKLEQQQRELERQRLVADSTYQALLKSLQEVRIRENQTVGNVRIIEAALAPRRPNASKRSAILAAGSLVGIGLAALYIYWLEITNKKIKTVQQAREILNCNLLGTIPVFDKREVQLPVIDKPRTSISESYWMLQTNLRFLNEDSATKVIAVTSAVPGEGKSTVCANVAASMAQLGYKILIVDADMHFPSQHQIWKLPNTEGLSSSFSEDVNLSSSAFHNVSDNLDVITSGILPANPLLVVDSRGMNNFLELCARNYDYVFVDTPALATAADAITLGRMADGVLIVIRPGVADASNVKLVKEYLYQSGQNILGLAVNGILPENEDNRVPTNYYRSQANNQYSKSCHQALNRERNWLENLRFIKRS